MGGDDDFEVSGKANKGILVRIVGGSGEDRITDESEVCGWSKKTLVYDTKDKNTLTLGHEAKDLTSKSRNINEYDFHGTRYNRVAPLHFSVTTWMTGFSWVEALSCSITGSGKPPMPIPKESWRMPLSKASSLISNTLVISIRYLAIGA
jgi:hypothetical protein